MGADHRPYSALARRGDRRALTGSPASGAVFTAAPFPEGFAIGENKMKGTAEVLRDEIVRLVEQAEEEALRCVYILLINLL